MENNTRLNVVRCAFQTLSGADKRISLSQVISVSGISDPGPEIHILIKRGEIINLTSEEFILV